MGLLNKFLGRSSTTQKASDLAVGTENPNAPIAKAFLGIFDRHLERLRQSGIIHGDKTMRSLVERTGQAVHRNVEPITSKILQTISNGNVHTWSESSKDLRLYLEVTVLPCSLSQAREFFAQRTPPGYSEYLNRVLNSVEADIAGQQGIHAVVHLVVCFDATSAELGVQVCLTPLTHQDTRGCPKVVIPQELLSPNERQMLGL